MVASLEVRDWTSDHDVNVERRTWLMRDATARERADFREAFALDPILWMRLTCWTFRPKSVDEETGRERPEPRPWWPMLPWPCQVTAYRTLERCVDEGRDCVVDKSRDMGASWVLAAAFFTHRWLFRSNFVGLLGSRHEDMVDKAGEPDSLFWKVDALVEQQPAWLLPGDIRDIRRGGRFRADKILRNPKNGSVISGQTATPDFGRAGRKNIAFYDEHAAWEHASAAWDAASETTSCRVSCSTQVPGTSKYNELLEQARRTGAPTLIELRYFQHPEKGRGAETRVDVDGSVTGVAKSEYVWTPWLAAQIARGRDKNALALNVFNRALGAGASYFRVDLFSQAKARDAKPGIRGEIAKGKFVPSDKGRVWIYDERMLDASWRATRTFAMGCDPSYGVGAANTSISVFDVESRTQVMEFADPYTDPIAAAQLIAAWGRGFLRGMREPIVAHETNGPGAGMQHEFERQSYYALYRQTTAGRVHDRATDKVGWTSDPSRKRELLADLGAEVTQRRATFRSAEFFSEACAYVVFENGSVGLATTRDMTTEARAAHGDRVIAGALALLACDEGFEEAKEPPKYERGSYGDVLGFEELEEAEP